MRSIINISLPKNMVAAIEDKIKKEHFSTKSEFFRNLIRLWMNGKLAEELEESRKELKAGKGKILTSLSDLR